MKITDVTKVQSGPNPHHVDARKIYDTDNAIAVVITLQTGESLKKAHDSGRLSSSMCWKAQAL